MAPTFSYASIVRACMASALDCVSGVGPHLSMMRQGTPERSSSQAIVSPTGPAPMTSAVVSECGTQIISVVVEVRQSSPLPNVKGAVPAPVSAAAVRLQHQGSGNNSANPPWNREAPRY